MRGRRIFQWDTHLKMDGVDISIEGDEFYECLNTDDVLDNGQVDTVDVLNDGQIEDKSEADEEEDKTEAEISKEKDMVDEEHSLKLRVNKISLKKIKSSVQVQEDPTDKMQVPKHSKLYNVALILTVLFTAFGVKQLADNLDVSIESRSSRTPIHLYEVHAWAESKDDVKLITSQLPDTLDQNRTWKEFQMKAFDMDTHRIIRRLNPCYEGHERQEYGKDENERFGPESLPHNGLEHAKLGHEHRFRKQWICNQDTTPASTEKKRSGQPERRTT